MSEEIKRCPNCGGESNIERGSFKVICSICKFSVSISGRTYWDIVDIWNSLPRNEWMEIESAPKDGSTIIASSISKELGLCWISQGKWSERYNKFWDGLEPSGFCGLTHWMPIPQRRYK